MTSQSFYKYHRFIQKLPASMGRPIMILLMRWSVVHVLFSGFDAISIACYEYTLKEGERQCQKIARRATRK